MSTQCLFTDSSVPECPFLSADCGAVYYWATETKPAVYTVPFSSIFLCFYNTKSISSEDKLCEILFWYIGVENEYRLFRKIPFCTTENILGVVLYEFIKFSYFILH